MARIEKVAPPYPPPPECDDAKAGDRRRQATEYRFLAQNSIDTDESSGMSSGEDPTWDDQEESTLDDEDSSISSSEDDYFSGSGSGSGSGDADAESEEDETPDSSEQEEELQVEQSKDLNTIPDDDEKEEDEKESKNDLGENYDEEEPNGISVPKKTPRISTDMDNKVETYVMAQKKGSQNPLESTEVLAAVIAGGVAGLMLAVLLIVFLVYRMRKKDQGSYMLGRPAAQPYQRTSDQEIYA
ncbi:syndecan-2-like [Lethenteron reissneri]|uniref:syndecan-2-like n=1 Tax=Lethenteron reissneri TaxID=7753 RepID=UPI002AB77890|nr:syndecan-2-like [Lethenteron reissneri]